MTDIKEQIIERYKNNPSARNTVLGWLRKSNRDAGNYFTRQLEEIGFCGDSKSGYDWGNLPENHYQE